jgi:hypothetical protein
MKNSITDILSEKTEGLKELYQAEGGPEILHKCVVRICDFYWHNVFSSLPTKSDIVQTNR